MIFNKKRKSFVSILCIGLLVFSFCMVSCSKDVVKQDPPPNGTHLPTESNANKEKNSPSDNAQEKPSEKGSEAEQNNDDILEKDHLSPLQGPALQRKPLHRYPSTMGPPSHGSMWNDNEIFVSTGEAGFTRIALSNQEMVETESYFYNRAFLQASTDYFLCRDKSHLFCMSKRDSREIWKQEISPSGNDYYFAVNEDIVVRMLFDSSLQQATVKGIQATTGKALWTMILEDKSHSFLGFSPSILLFTEGSSLVGIHPSTGEKSWQHNAILQLSDEPYQQEYYRNFRILSDYSIFIPIQENGEPFAYRIEPQTGEILAEYRYESPQEVRFQSSYIEQSSSILCSYRKASQYFFIAFDKDHGNVLWQTPFHQVLGDFSKQHGVECEYTILESLHQRVLVEISFSTIVCLNTETGEILWSHQSEFSQLKAVWKDAIYTRLIESQDQKIRIEFVSIETGSLLKDVAIPSTFQIPNAAISCIYTTDQNILVRMNIEDNPYWLFFKPDGTSIDYGGYLPESEETLPTNLVFFVTSKHNQMLFLVSGENGYELEIFTIPDYAYRINGDPRQANYESPLL
jgi:outer membrane protein assembly factor BamB